MTKHGSTGREGGGCQPRSYGFDMLLLSLPKLCPVKVKTQMKRSLFSTSSFGAYFIAFRPSQAILQISTSAETDHFVSWGSGLYFNNRLPGLLTAYFLTPNIMEKKCYISHDCANIAVRALYCYKRLIGIGADLHGDMPDRALQQQIDAATSEIWSQAKGKTESENKGQVKAK